MPQGRKKVPFSGKAKKAQLKDKRERNETKQKFGSEDRMNSIPFSSTSEGNTEENKIIVNAGKDKTDLLLDLQTSSHSGNKSGARRIQNNATRYELRFNQESKQDLAERREKARQPLKPIDSSDLEKTIDEYFPASLDFPTRPEWNESMSKISMESNEARYFRKYVEDIFDKHENTQLSFFELNLETWRQLWRVIEKSDILLLVVDARYPAAMFPPSLYHYVISQKKHFILVLNKVDLIPGSLALAWKEYFKERFPEIHVTFFTSCPTYNLVTGVIASGEHSGLKFRRLRGRISMVTDGAKQIQEICKQIVETDQSKISPSDLNSWESKILKSDHGSAKRQENVSEVKIEVESDTSKVLTIGMLGQPNAGKSSLINSLMGKRVVSVSKTPGHTKHFQTIYITKFVVLCDCPGLVFPSLVPKQLQVLLGSFPISQVKEPFSVVQYIAERLNLPKILQIIHPENEEKWSAYDICEGWALKRSYITARSNRPDIHRAANHILRMTLEGKITVTLEPPGYRLSLEKWSEHPDLVAISELLGTNSTNNDESDQIPEESILTDSDEEDSEESESDEEETETCNKFNALASCGDDE